MTALAAPDELVAVHILDHAALCRHEAGHATGGLLAGLKVRQVRAPYRSPQDAHGIPKSRTGWMVTERLGDLRAHAISVLCGPLFEGAKAWPPPWPIPPAPISHDQGALAGIVGEMGLDRRGYHELIGDTLDLARSPLFKRLAGLIADRLEEFEELGAGELDRLRTIAEEHAMDEDEYEIADELPAAAEAFGRQVADELRARMAADNADVLRAKALREQPVVVASFHC